MTALARMRSADGQVFTIGGHDWTFEVDDESRWAGYACHDCGESVTTEDKANDHECRRCTGCQTVLHDNDWPADVTVCDDCLDKREARLDVAKAQLDALRPVDCEDCEGTGQIGVERGYFGKWETGICESCGGTGEVRP